LLPLFRRAVDAQGNFPINRTLIAVLDFGVVVSG